MTEETAVQSQDMTTAELSRLNELEATVKKGFTTFIEVGLALKEIQSSRLYRKKHGTFEAYCKDTFEVAKRTAYDLIEASSVVQNVRNSAQIGWEPKNQSQAQALKDVAPEDLEEVCRIISMAAQERDIEITAALITRVVAEFAGEQAKVKLQRTRQQINNDPTITGEFGAAFDSILSHIEDFNRDGSLRPRRKVIIERLQAIIEAIAMDNSHAKSTKSCAMHKTDLEKLLEGGYRIFKKDFGKGVIEEYEFGEWVMFEDFIDRTEEMDAAFNTLMLDDKNLRG